MIERTEESEQRAEGIAYGLFVLDSPIFGDHANHWRRLPELRRDLYMARARFILATADAR